MSRRQTKKRVGKGVPPDKYKWPKGRSGNPKGRPKGSRNRSTVFREVLELVTEEENELTGKVEKRDQQFWLAMALVRKAKKGNLRAFEIAMDSIYGKIPDQPAEEAPPQKQVQVVFAEELPEKK